MFSSNGSFGINLNSVLSNMLSQPGLYEKNLNCLKEKKIDIRLLHSNQDKLKLSTQINQN